LTLLWIASLFKVLALHTYMRSLQHSSKQEKRQLWTECTEYVWRSRKLVSGHRNGRSPHSSHFPRKVILNSVQITEQLLLSHTQARSFFGSYWKGSEWRPKQKLQTNRRDSDKERGQQIKWRISEYWCTRQQPLYMCFVDFKKAFDSISHDKLWVTMMDMGYSLHLIDLLSKLYRKRLAEVKVASTRSEWFCVKKGADCVLSPYLFNVRAEMVMRETLNGFQGGLQIGGQIVTNLRYADDIILLAEL